MSPRSFLAAFLIRTLSHNHFRHKDHISHHNTIIRITMGPPLDHHSVANGPTNGPTMFPRSFLATFLLTTPSLAPSVYEITLYGYLPIGITMGSHGVIL